MPYMYKIIKELKLNYVKATGTVVGKEIVDTSRKMFKDPEWNYVRKQISDFREVKELVIEFQEFETIVGVEKEQQEKQEKIHNGETGKLAIVADKELYDIIFKLYEFKTAEGFHETKLFNTLDEALVWLYGTSLNSNKQSDMEKALMELLG
ncbi:MAG: hypothetical protein WCE54_19825 [Ignavibacteriaceae bacterium]